MKTIRKDELFENLSSFLKDKGIELTEGSYSQRVRQGCSLLADVINTTHATVRRAKAGADRNLDKLRQVIHEKTAPKATPPTAGEPASATPPPPTAKAVPPSAPAVETARATPRSPRKPRKAPRRQQRNRARSRARPRAR